MNFRPINRTLYHRMIISIGLFLLSAGCALPLPASTPAVTPVSTLPATATTPLTDTQSAPTGDLPTGGGDQMAERIEFAPNTTVATVSGTLAASNEMNYALALATSQTVTVTVLGDRAPVNFTVYGPSGTTWAGAAQADADTGVITTFTAPETGDYLVTLAVPAEGTETVYAATFTVATRAVERITFPGGETTTERSGTLDSGAANLHYLLSANSGMTLTVDATSDAVPLSMTIESPSGNRWIPEMMPADEGYTIGHAAVLPEPGYYLVTLAKSEEALATDYTVTFTLQ